MQIKETDNGFAVELAIKLPHGLHSRPSAKLAQLAQKFQSHIMLLSENGEVDAKSMLDILSLALPTNARVRLLAKGPDAKEALTALYTMLAGEHS